MIQGVSSAAALTPPVSQTARQQPVQQPVQDAQLQSPASGAQSAQSSGAGSSAFDTAQQILEAKTGLLKTSLETQGQVIDLLA